MSHTETDPVAAALEESRVLGREYVAVPGPLGQLGREVLLLRDTLEAVLALPGQWRETAADLGKSAEKAADEKDPVMSRLLGWRAQAHTECAAGLERAIAAKLLGEGSDD